MLMLQISALDVNHLSKDSRMQYSEIEIFGQMNAPNLLRSNGQFTRYPNSL